MGDLLSRVEQKQIEGLSPSMPHQQGRLFKTGSNVIFQESSVQPLPGELLLVPKLSSLPVLGLCEHLRTNGVKQLYWGNEDALYNWNPTDGTVSRGSGYTGISDQTTTARVSHWSFAPWGDWMIATNGVDDVQIDKNGGLNFGNLTGVTFTWAQIVKKYGPYLIAFNTSNNGRYAEWSDEEDPESWTIGSASAAGFLPINDLESDIVAVAELGRIFAMYGTDSAHAFALVGGDEIFAARKLLTGIGAVGKHAVCSVGTANYGFGPRGLWVTDGSSHKYIDDPEIHDLIYGDINLDQISKAVVWYDKLFDQVVFWWTTADAEANNKAVAYNRRSDNWSVWDFGRSAAAESSIFKYGITADEKGNVYGQSVLDAPSGTQGSPVQHTATATLESGYGEGGYGEGGYGGSWTVDG